MPKRARMMLIPAYTCNGKLYLTTTTLRDIGLSTENSINGYCEVSYGTLEHVRRKYKRNYGEGIDIDFSFEPIELNKKDSDKYDYRSRMR